MSDTANLRAQLEHTRNRYQNPEAVQIRVPTPMFAVWVSDDCPHNLIAIKQAIKERQPTYVLLRPSQLETLLNHAERHQPEPAANISGQPGANVDDQIDGRLD